MNNNDIIMDALGEIDPEFVREARPKNRRSTLMRVCSAAAVVLLLAGTVIALPAVIKNHEAKYGNVTAAVDPTENSDEALASPVSDGINIGMGEGALPGVETFPGGSNGMPDPGYGDYLDSDDPEEIFAFSEVVMLAKVTGIDPAMGMSDPARMGCTVEIERIVKDERGALEADEDGHTLILLVPLDAVRIGESYVFCLVNCSDDGTVFAVTAQNGIYLPDSEDGRNMLPKDRR